MSHKNLSSVTTLTYDPGTSPSLSRSDIKNRNTFLIQAAGVYCAVPTTLHPSFFMLHTLKRIGIEVTLNEVAYSTSKAAVLPRPLPSLSIRLADYDAISRKCNRGPSSLVS